MINSHFSKILFIAAALLFASCGEDEGRPDCAIDDSSVVFSVIEHSDTGTIVGEIDIEAPAERALSFNITSGNEGNTFAIDNNGIITINNNEILDFETRQRFQLEVEVGAQNCESGTIDVTVILVNIIDEFS